MRATPERVPHDRSPFNRPARGAAWKFVLPDEADQGVACGPQLSVHGGIQMTHGLDAARQDICLLLGTRPGERVMRPEYGCDLQRLVFASNDDTTAGLAIHYVKRALDRWQPRIDVLRVDARRDPDRPEVLAIEVEYRLRTTHERDTLTHALNLDGG
jgi:uncharacterized protein